MKNIIKSIALILIIGLSYNSQAQVVVTTRPARPAVVVVKPTQTRANYIWVDGHWNWNKKQKRYVWSDGYWKRARKNQNWQAGYWVTTGNGHKWVPGRWIAKPRAQKRQRVRKTRRVIRRHRR